MGLTRANAAMKAPNRTIDVTRAARVINKVSAVPRHFMTEVSYGMPLAASRSSRSRKRQSRLLPDDAFDEVIHRFQLGPGGGLALGQDFLLLVVEQRPLEDHERAVHELGLHRVRGLAGLGAYLVGVRRRLHDPFLQAAAHYVRQLLALLEHGDVIGVNLLPVPLGAGEVALGSEHRLVAVIAADVDAALLGRLDY